MSIRYIKLVLLSSLLLMVGSFLRADDEIVVPTDAVDQIPIVDTSTIPIDPPITVIEEPPVVMDSGPFLGKAYLVCSTYNATNAGSSLYYIVRVDTLAYFPDPITGDPVEYCKTIDSYQKYWKVDWLTSKMPGSDKVFGVREDDFLIAVTQPEYLDYLENAYTKDELIQLLNRPKGKR